MKIPMLPIHIKYGTSISGQDNIFQKSSQKTTVPIIKGLIPREKYISTQRLQKYVNFSKFVSMSLDRSDEGQINMP